ncbi:MAG: hypothetical protein ACXAC5_04405 [Promethearchaeota archaeon]|jgi:hypothetical protein
MSENSIIDKKLSDTTDQELILEYVGQLKEDNKRLKKELEAHKQPKFLVDADKLSRAFDHWTWGAIVVIGIILGVILTIYHVWPSTYETGRFYLSHQIIDYKIPAPCREQPARACWLPAGDKDSCYTVIKEVENGGDDSMTACIRDKDIAYKTANEFADEWKRLKEKEESHE